MKKIFFLCLTYFLVGCGSKQSSEDETKSDCKENQYLEHCTSYRADLNRNVKIPDYEGCANAYKYHLNPDGSGKLAVLPANPAEVDTGSRNTLVNLLDPSTKAVISSQYVLDSYNRKHPEAFTFDKLVIFDLSAGKEYLVRCDAEYKGFEVDYSVPVTGRTRFRVKMNSDDSKSRTLGCAIDKISGDGVLIKLRLEEDHERMVIKRDGRVVGELTNNKAFEFSDRFTVERGREYKYTCSSIKNGIEERGAYSATAKLEI